MGSQPRILPDIRALPAFLRGRFEFLFAFSGGFFRRFIDLVFWQQLRAGKGRFDAGRTSGQVGETSGYQSQTTHQLLTGAELSQFLGHFTKSPDRQSGGIKEVFRQVVFF